MTVLADAGASEKQEGAAPDGPTDAADILGATNRTRARTTSAMRRLHAILLAAARLAHANPAVFNFAQKKKGAFKVDLTPVSLPFPFKLRFRGPQPGRVGSSLQ